MNNTDLQTLTEASKYGIIDLADVRSQIERMQQDEIISMCPYKYWCGQNGKWYVYLPDDDRGRVLKKRNSEEDIRKLIFSFYINSDDTIPRIKTIFNEWNDYKLASRHIIDSTYLKNQQVFRRHYSEFGNMLLEDVTADLFVEFLENELRDKNLTVKAFSNLKGITRGMLNRAYRKKLISFSGDEVISMLDVSDKSFRKTFKEDCEEVFNEEETAAIEAYLRENIDIYNMIIALMFATGLRVGEAAALKHEDIDGNAINIRRTETRKLVDGKITYDVKDKPKTEAGARTVVVPTKYTWLMNKIRLTNPFGEYIFEDAGRRINTNNVRRRLARICDKLNIVHKSPHKIRKTYGTILLDNGVDERFILDQMGHTTINTTERHYHRTRRKIDAKVAILDSLPEFSRGNQAQESGNQIRVVFPKKVINDFL